MSAQNKIAKLIAKRDKKIAKRDQLIEEANNIAITNERKNQQLFVVVESTQDITFLNAKKIDNVKDRFSDSLTVATIFDDFDEATNARLNVEKAIVNCDQNDICMIKMIVVDLFEQIDRTIKIYDMHIDFYEKQIAELDEEYL